MIICVTGFPGAGKSEVAKILREMGFKVYELGDIVRGLMRERHVEINPKNDNEFAIMLRKKYGNMVTTKILVKKTKLNKKTKGDIAIVGFRSKPEIDYVKKHVKSAVVIALIAPVATRFKRIRQRKRADDAKTLKVFVKNRDKREIGFGILEATKAADHIISNTGTLEELRKGIEEIIADNS